MPAFVNPQALEMLTIARQELTRGAEKKRLAEAARPRQKIAALSSRGPVLMHGFGHTEKAVGSDLLKRLSRARQLRHGCPRLSGWKSETESSASNGKVAHNLAEAKTNCASGTVHPTGASAPPC